MRRPLTKVAVLDIADDPAEGNAAPPEALDVHYGSGDVGGETTLILESAQPCASSPECHSLTSVTHNPANHPSSKYYLNQTS